MNILFFTPHVALWAHTVPEMYLAKGLANAGHNIEILTCGKAMNYCSAMTARSVGPGSSIEKYTNICNDCVLGSDAIKKVLGLKIRNLFEFAKSEDFAIAKKKCQSVFSSKKQELHLYKINIGKISLYEFFLTYKKRSLEFSENDWNNYYYYLYNSFISLYLFEKYLANTKKIDAVFSFSPQYSNIHSCMEYAKKSKIQTYFCESGNNLSHRLGTMRVWDWDIHKLVNPGLRFWKGAENHQITKSKVKKVKNHLQVLFKSNHFTVYSESKGQKENSKLKNITDSVKNKKVFLMTLSSADESYAAYLIGCFPYQKVFSNVFNDQLQWIQETISFFKEKSNWVLVIRVHPREFPNKRDQVTSEQAGILVKNLKNVNEKNILINWPDENISIYDLFDITDVVITGWSATAIEAMVHGIPVVTYDRNLPSYPSDIHWTGTTKDEYFKNLSKACIAGRSFKNTLNAFRWLSFNFSECIVELCKNFGDFEIKKPKQFKLINKILQFTFKKLPFLKFGVDLLSWRQAKHGSKIVSLMICKKATCLPEIQYRREIIPENREKRYVKNACNELSIKQKNIKKSD